MGLRRVVVGVVMMVVVLLGVVVALGRAPRRGVPERVRLWARLAIEGVDWENSCSFRRRMPLTSRGVKSGSVANMFN